MSGKDRLKKHITGFHYLRTDTKALEFLDQLHINNFVLTEAVVYNDVEVCQEYLDGIWFYVYYDEPIGSLGLGAARDIPANTDLMLYAGDVITKEDKKKMEEQEAKSATDDKGEVLTNYLLPVEGNNYTSMPGSAGISQDLSTTPVILKSGTYGLSNATSLAKVWSKCVVGFPFHRMK